MVRVHNPIETMDPQEIPAFQWKRLKKQLAYVYERSRFYRRRLHESRIRPDDIKTPDDFRRIPFTTKEDLRRHNRDFICVENKDIIDIGGSTGTTGTPVILPVTANDWNNLVETLHRFALALNITNEDVCQLSVAFDQLFSVSAPWDDALKQMGVTVVRTGPGNLRRQLEIMRQVGTTVIIATPDFMLLLAGEAKSMGLDPGKDLNTRLCILCGQSLHTADWQPNTLNRRIREEWGIEVYSDYGSMEMFAGFMECDKHGGHHTCPDHHILEIVDPETGLPAAPGRPGELIATHLTMEGIPLIRFRQGDITSIEAAPCPCGRTSPRIMALLGRVDHMLKIKGTTVYPEQIEEALVSIPRVTAYVIEAFTDNADVDRIRIKAACEGETSPVFDEIRKSVKAKARIAPDVIEPITKDEATAIWFSEGTRKAKRFWDKRTKQP